jgi:hypothetical protein
MAFDADGATRGQATESRAKIRAVLLVTMVATVAVVGNMDAASEHYAIAYSYSGVRGNVHRLTTSNMVTNLDNWFIRDTCPLLHRLDPEHLPGEEAVADSYEPTSLNLRTSTDMEGSTNSGNRKLPQHRDNLALQVSK